MPTKNISRPWLVFTLVAVAQFMVVLDISITNVALPSIKTDLHFMSDSTLQWVITAYALTCVLRSFHFSSVFLSPR
jgi:MFS family permease